MGYQNEYIINNDVEDSNEPVFKKTVQPVKIAQNQPQDDYEVIEPQTPSQNIMDEIHESALAEGLVHEDEKPFGGEGNPNPKEVISDFINQKRPESVEEKVEEYTEKKIENTRKVMATRELLTGLTEKVLTVTVPMALEVQLENGDTDVEVCDVEFKVKRLTESQANHVFNRQLAGKKVAEMSNEELDEDNHFRSNFLANAIIEPKISAEEWYNMGAIIVGSVFHEVNNALSSLDNTALFR